jgi:hypothetical protein
MGILSMTLLLTAPPLGGGGTLKTWPEQQFFLPPMQVIL